MSNPANCVRAGGYHTWDAYGIAVSGHYAYLASGRAGLEVADTNMGGASQRYYRVSQP